MIKALVFEGGGVKGAAYAGALQQLENYTDLSQIKYLGGASAGAITAVLLAAGYKPATLEQISLSMPYKSLTPRLNPFTRMYRLISRKGMYYSTPLKAFLYEQVGAICGNPKISFGELFFRNRTYLRIVATNSQQQDVMTFSIENSPTLPIVDAAIFSMTIPYVFIPESYDGYAMTDGGIALNYPIRLFDDLLQPDQVLGLRLDSSEEVKASSNGYFGYVAQESGNSLKDFTMNHFSMIYERLNKAHLSEKDWKRTIFIDCGNVSSMDFNLNDIDIKTLMTRGKMAVINYYGNFKKINTAS